MGILPAALEPAARPLKESPMALKVGDVAPDFTLVDENGEKVALSSLRGQNVVVVFYPLDFSPTCTSELKSIASHKTKYDALKATVLGISVDSKYTHAAFKRDEGLTARLLADFHPKGAVAQQYGVYMDQAGIAKRGTFVIDAKGIIQGVTVQEPGNARDENAYFEALSHCAI
jgi:peroxiredoxin